MHVNGVCWMLCARARITYNTSDGDANAMIFGSSCSSNNHMFNLVMKYLSCIVGFYLTKLMRI